MKVVKKLMALIIVLFFLIFFVFSNTAQGAGSDIIFTEIMYNPSGSDTKKEWVEIYNSGSEPIVIIEGSGNDSWRFNDGSNHTFTLFQGSLTVQAGEYAILASDAQTFLNEHEGFSKTIIDTVMSLNNTSDVIKLSSDKGGSFFGSVTYEDTQGADGDGYSLQLSGSSWIAADTTEGQTTASQESQEESTTTPSEPSSSSSADTIPGISDTEKVEIPQTSGIASKVKITEIFPNPEGDENQEFIELWNNQNESISLEGFKLADASKVITLSGITLVPGEYFAIYRSATKIALNNSKETVLLYDNNGSLIDSVEYSSTIEGYSMSYDINKKKFFWTSTKTPSKSNEITTPNEPPEAVIIFSNNPIASNEKVTISAIDSTDADDDKISFLWKIGKNFQASGMKFKYSFQETGSYIIKLIVNDGQHEVVATSVINVLHANEILSLRRRLALNPVQHQDSREELDAARISTQNINIAPGQIYITEIFPNPTGRDDNEWIELYNSANSDISLNGWIIDDQDGGSRPHTISDRIIQAQSYLILGKEETKLTLNNSSDEVRLFNADEKLIDEVLYDDVQEDQSYTKSDDGFWFWTSDTTPGETNITDSIISYNNFTDSSFLTTPIPTSSQFTDTFTDIVDIDLPNIRELEIGTEVRVQGTVAVEPGILGKTYFYITGSPGIQVYFYKKDWPKLAIGDVVGVIGELTESNNELRLKISNKEDIVPLYASDPPAPLEARTGDISESLEGALIKITAELVEKKGASWYLDDGSGEIKITFQPSANIKKPPSREGDWIEVVGIVSETKSGYRVLPRYQNDINIVNLEKIDARETSKESGIVLGDQAMSESNGIQRFRIPENRAPNKILTYLIITTSALMALFAGLFIKLRVEIKKRERDLKK